MTDITWADRVDDDPGSPENLCTAAVLNEIKEAVNSKRDIAAALHPDGVYATVAALVASNTTLAAVYVMGYYSSFDGGAGPWKYAASAPAHGLYITTANGRRYVPSDPEPTLLQLGVRVWATEAEAAAVDDTAKVQLAANYSMELRKIVKGVTGWVALWAEINVTIPPSGLQLKSFGFLSPGYFQAGWLICFNGYGKAAFKATGTSIDDSPGRVQGPTMQGFRFRWHTTSVQNPHAIMFLSAGTPEIDISCAGSNNTQLILGNLTDTYKVRAYMFGGGQTFHRRIPNESITGNISVGSTTLEIVGGTVSSLDVGRTVLLHGGGTVNELFEIQGILDPTHAVVTKPADRSHIGGVLVFEALRCHVDGDTIDLEAVTGWTANSTHVGLPLIILGAGENGGAHVCRVTSAPAPGVLVIDPPAPTTISNAIFGMSGGYMFYGYSQDIHDRNDDIFIEDINVAHFSGLCGGFIGQSNKFRILQGRLHGEPDIATPGAAPAMALVIDNIRGTIGAAGWGIESQYVPPAGKGLINISRGLGRTVFGPLEVTCSNGISVVSETLDNVGDAQFLSVSYGADVSEQTLRNPIKHANPAVPKVIWPDQIVSTGSQGSYPDYIPRMFNSVGEYVGSRQGPISWVPRFGGSLGDGAIDYATTNGQVGHWWLTDGWAEGYGKMIVETVNTAPTGTLWVLGLPANLTSRLIPGGGGYSCAVSRMFMDVNGSAIQTGLELESGTTRFRFFEIFDGSAPIAFNGDEVIAGGSIYFTFRFPLA